MKRCAILFAILIITLFIAVWVEQRHGEISMDEVALEDMNTIKTNETSGHFSE